MLFDKMKFRFVIIVLLLYRFVLFGFFICLFVRFYLAFVRNKDTDSTHHILFPRILFVFFGLIFFLYTFNNNNNSNRMQQQRKIVSFSISISISILSSTHSSALWLVSSSVMLRT